MKEGLCWEAGVALCDQGAEFILVLDLYLVGDAVRQMFHCQFKVSSQNLVN